MKFRSLALAAVVTLLPAAASAQTGHAGPDIFGTWEARIPASMLQKKNPNAVAQIVIRPDSSASYGTQTVRWRLKPDSIMIALGGEWITYRLQLKRLQLTLSGGDLTEPVSLKRVGPPTARPDSVPIPPDPDTEG